MEATSAEESDLPDVAAIIFDAVGTLLHPNPAAAEAYVMVGRRFGSRHDVDVIRERFRAGFSREEEADGRNNLRTSEAREVQRWRNIVCTVLDDVPDQEACFSALFEHFAQPDAWRCDPEAGIVLAELSRRGILLGIASNFDQRLRRVVAGFEELRPVAEHLIISSEIGWRKPAPAFFTALCEHFCLPAERLLLVGDDRHNDYDGARAAGLQAILLDSNPLLGVERRVSSLGSLLHPATVPGLF
jgi:putative hydrolase of the HAD superfamily